VPIAVQSQEHGAHGRGLKGGPCFKEITVINMAHVNDNWDAKRKFCVPGKTGRDPGCRESFEWDGGSDKIQSALGSGRAQGREGNKV
jgi:hypothetical protein